MTSREGQGVKDWAELRTATIDRFNGQTPHPATETDSIRAYELHPDAVEKAIGAPQGDTMSDPKDALLQALFDLLTEEQQRAEHTMETQGRRNAAPAAVSDAVQRVFLNVGPRTIAKLTEAAAP